MKCITSSQVRTQKNSRDLVTSVSLFLFSSRLMERKNFWRKTQVSPETPVWHHCLSYPQCAVYFPEPGPRAPACQMVVRIKLCPCPEGREDPENQPNRVMEIIKLVKDAFKGGEDM